jgi:Tfp pilus assembly protein PilO
MQKLPKEKRDLIIAIVMGTIMVVVALYLLLIANQNKTLEVATRQIEDKSGQNRKAMVLLQQEKQYRQELDVAQLKLEKIEATMASGGMISWIYKTMNDFMSRHRNVVLSEVQNNPKLGDVGMFPQFPYQAVTFNVEVTAFYHDFGKFLADFENYYPFFRVQNLETGPSRKAGPGEDEKLGFRMEIVTLVKPGSAL